VHEIWTVNAYVVLSIHFPFVICVIVALNSVKAPTPQSQSPVVSKEQCDVPQQETAGGRKMEVARQQHLWIVTTPDGYYCQICQVSQFGTGPWVEIPISKSNSKKLYKKADKHSRSSMHKLAWEKSRSSGLSVVEQQFMAANRQTDRQISMLTAQENVEQPIVCFVPSYPTQQYGGVLCPWLLLLMIVKT